MIPNNRLLVYLYWSVTIVGWSFVAGIKHGIIDSDTINDYVEYCSLDNITHHGLSTACCGTCKLDPNCKLHGTCCLYEYRTFKAAAAAADSSRYE